MSAKPSTGSCFPSSQSRSVRSSQCAPDLAMLAHAPSKFPRITSGGSGRQARPDVNDGHAPRPACLRAPARGPGARSPEAQRPARGIQRLARADPSRGEVSPGTDDAGGVAWPLGTLIMPVAGAWARPVAAHCWLYADGTHRGNLCIRIDCPAHMSHRPASLINSIPTGHARAPRPLALPQMLAATRRELPQPAGAGAVARPHCTAGSQWHGLSSRRRSHAIYRRPASHPALTREPLTAPSRKARRGRPLRPLPRHHPTMALLFRTADPLTRAQAATQLVSLSLAPVCPRLPPVPRLRPFGVAHQRARRPGGDFCPAGRRDQTPSGRALSPPATSTAKVSLLASAIILRHLSRCHPRGARTGRLSPPRGAPPLPCCRDPRARRSRARRRRSGPRRACRSRPPSCDLCA